MFKLVHYETRTFASELAVDSGLGFVGHSVFWLLLSIIYFRKYMFWEDIHRCECVLAGIYQRHGKSTKALRHWEEAYQAACKSGDKESQAEALKAKSEVQLTISSHLSKGKLQLYDDVPVLVNIKTNTFALS